jgi:hypothetical protein
MFNETSNSSNSNSLSWSGNTDLINKNIEKANKVLNKMAFTGQLEPIQGVDFKKAKKLIRVNFANHLSQQSLDINDKKVIAEFFSLMGWNSTQLDSYLEKNSIKIASK